MEVKVRRDEDEVEEEAVDEDSSQDFLLVPLLLLLESLRIELSLGPTDSEPFITPEPW